MDGFFDGQCAKLKVGKPVQQAASLLRFSLQLAPQQAGSLLYHSPRNSEIETETERNLTRVVSLCRNHSKRLRAL
jgi:hypothetical protein